MCRCSARTWQTESGRSAGQLRRLAPPPRALRLRLRVRRRVADVGDRAQLLAADNELRARAGLPQRREYALTEKRDERHLSVRDRPAYARFVLDLLLPRSCPSAVPAALKSARAALEQRPANRCTALRFAAARRPSGPSSAAANAQVGVLHLRRLAPLSRTTPRFAGSSPAGRNAGSAVSRRQRRSSSLPQCRDPVRTSSRSSPPDRDRALQRGHHPPEALARELAKRWQLPSEPLLRRTRAIARQSGLERAKRRQKRRRRAPVACASVPTRVVLVDDVHTSGAIAAAAASALRAGGTRHVDVITLARAIRSG